MLSFKNLLLKNHRAVFYSAWLILYLIQGYTTELFDDEAYYWVYSRSLDWGYFDHPPMIALLIKAGYAIFPNELGVRLFCILLTTASVFLIETLTNKKDPYLFYAICASLAIAQLGGMMAVPDTPLMFFVAWYFFIYQKFIKRKNLANTLLLGIAVALMMYSKYHAVLVVIFTVFSNLRLLKNSRFYLALFIALVLFAPHLYWQYKNDYPSVQFHLFERNSHGYEAFNTIEYILGQVLIAGPIMGWLLILAALSYKPENGLQRALKFSFTGIYIFFLISTFKGKAEANWTIPSFIGLMVLSHQYLRDHEKWKSWLYRAVPVTLLLVFAARAVMMIDMPPAWWILKDEFHGNRNVAKAIELKAENRPVVFIDTYQKPSKYWFYSGNTAMALNTPRYRRNNFNFWKIEDSLIGKPVYAVGVYDEDVFPDRFATLRLETNGGTEVDNYFSFSRVMINGISIPKKDSAVFTIAFSSITPPNYLPFFRQLPYDTCQLYLAIYQKKELIKYIPANTTLRDITKPLQKNLVSISPPLPRGSYTAKFAITNCLPGNPSLNSSGFDLEIR